MSNETIFKQSEIEALTAQFIRACEIKKIDVTEKEIERAFEVFAKIRCLNIDLENSINEGYPIYVNDIGEIVLVDSEKSFDFQ